MLKQFQKYLKVSMCAARRDLENIYRYGAGAPKFQELIFVKVSDIQSVSPLKKKELGWNPFSSGKVISAWPEEYVTEINMNEKIKFCLEHFINGTAWQDTGAKEYYKLYYPDKSALEIERWIINRHKPLNDIYKQIVSDGRIKQQKELGSAFRNMNGIRINIGPRGEPVVCDGGTHRLAMAIAASIQEIPATIGVVHYKSLETVEKYRAAGHCGLINKV